MALSNTALAEWVEVFQSKDNQYTIYVDSGTIERHPEFNRVWVKEEQPGGHEVVYQEDYHRSKRLFRTYYLKIHRKDEPPTSFYTSEIDKFNWEPVEPNSFKDLLYILAHDL